LRNVAVAKELSDKHADDAALAPAGISSAEADRRSHERFVTVFRLAKLIGAREEFCLVRNVSAGGLKAQAFSPKVVGDRLTVDLGDELPRPAQVAWVEGDSVGISFDKKIDVARALSKAPQPGRSRARPIRLTVGLDATVTVGKTDEKCQLVDISQGGAKLAIDAALRPGDDLVLQVPGLGRLICVVRWTRKGNVGVAFPGQVPYRRLAPWVGGLSRGDA
jgi:hypothetical protein